MRRVRPPWSLRSRSANSTAPRSCSSAASGRSRSTTTTTSTCSTDRHRRFGFSTRRECTWRRWADRAKVPESSAGPRPWRCSRTVGWWYAIPETSGSRSSFPGPGRRSSGGMRWAACTRCGHSTPTATAAPMSAPALWVGTASPCTLSCSARRERRSTRRYLSRGRGATGGFHALGGAGLRRGLRVGGDPR